MKKHKMTEKRYYDIDWLRVLGMFTIFLFHNARFFNEDDWHVKNFELSFGMSVFVAILDHFIMPLFFVLSAIAIYYALKKRSNAEFMRERVTRLLIPLGFLASLHTLFCKSTSRTSRKVDSQEHFGNLSHNTLTVCMPSAAISHGWACTCGIY